MKYLFCIQIATFLLSAPALSNTKWSSLIKAKKYTTDREIVLEKEEFKMTVPRNSALKLIDAMSLPMIKVELLKFDLSEFCTKRDSISDIKLIDVKQSSGTISTVGADLAVDCIMEVFVETKDVYSNSFFK